MLQENPSTSVRESAKPLFADFAQFREDHAGTRVSRCENDRCTTRTQETHGIGTSEKPRQFARRCLLGEFEPRRPRFARRGFAFPATRFVR
jgi:hypothetical protein